MSEYKKLDEWFPGGRGDGRKFTAYGWEEYAWIEPIFISKPCYVYETTWHCLDEGGHNYPISRERLQLKFKEWHPPKKKVTKYLWVHKKTSSMLFEFYKDYQDISSNYTHHDYEKNYIRLDWSATEFDDE